MRNPLQTLKNYSVPAGYLLRTYQPGDEPHFYRLLELVGWQGWNDEKLKPSREFVSMMEHGAFKVKAVAFQITEGFFDPQPKRSPQQHALSCA